MNKYGHLHQFFWYMSNCLELSVMINDSIFFTLLVLVLNSSYVASILYDHPLPSVQLLVLTLTDSILNLHEDCSHIHILMI